MGVETSVEIVAALVIGFVVLLAFGASIAGTVFWIWMLVDCATKEPEGSEKIAWVLIIIFTHWIGALIYLFARRPERMAKYGR